MNDELRKQKPNQRNLFFYRKVKMNQYEYKRVEQNDLNRLFRIITLVKYTRSITVSLSFCENNSFFTTISENPRENNIAITSI